MVEMALLLWIQLRGFQINTDEAITLPLQKCLEKSQAVLDGPVPGIGNKELILGVRIFSNENFFILPHFSY